MKHVLLLFLLFFGFFTREAKSLPLYTTPQSLCNDYKGDDDDHEKRCIKRHRHYSKCRGYHRAKYYKKQYRKRFEDHDDDYDDDHEYSRNRRYKRCTPGIRKGVIIISFPEVVISN